MHFPGQAPLRALQTRFSAPRHSVRSHLLAGTAVLGVSGPALAADFTVTSGADSGPGTYRAAVGQANAAPGNDRILFSTTPVTIASDVSITSNLTIGGPPGVPTVIQGTGAQRIEGTGAISVRLGASATLTNASTDFLASAVNIGALVGSKTFIIDGTIRPPTFVFGGQTFGADGVVAFSQSAPITVTLSSTGLIQTQSQWHLGDIPRHDRQRAGRHHRRRWQGNQPAGRDHQHVERADPRG